MSRLVNISYEYAQYDDTQGVLSPPKDTPPTYPPTLDQFKHTSRTSGVQSFGSQSVIGTSATPVFTPAGATVQLFAAASNTSLTGISVTTPLTVGGSAQSAVMLFGPGQTMTLTPPHNPGSFTVGGYTGTTPNSTVFNVTIVWHL